MNTSLSLDEKLSSWTRNLLAMRTFPLDVEKETNFGIGVTFGRVEKKPQEENLPSGQVPTYLGMWNLCLS